MAQTHPDSYDVTANTDKSVLQTYNTFIPGTEFTSFQDYFKYLIDKERSLIESWYQTEYDLSHESKLIDAATTVVKGIATGDDMLDIFRQIVAPPPGSTIKGYEPVMVDPLHIHSRYATDTSVGGNDVINPLYGFNPNDDVVHPIYETTAGQGMGRVYAEMYNSNQEYLSLTFGVPRFHGPLAFANNSTNADMAEAAAAGDTHIGNIIKNVLRGIVIRTVQLAVLPYTLAHKLATHKKEQYVSRWVDFEQSMVQYYGYVNTILIHFQEAMGLTAEAFKEDDEESIETGKDNKQVDDVLAQFALENGKLPYILQNDGDIISILTKRSRIIAGKDAEQSILRLDDLVKDSKAAMKSSTGGQYIQIDPKLIESGVVKPDAKDWMDYAVAAGKTVLATGEALIKLPFVATWKLAKAVTGNAADLLETGMTTFKSGMAGNLMFVRIRIPKSGNASETFSNETGESSLGTSLKSKAGEGIDRVFTIGKLAKMPVVKQVFQAASWTTDLVTNLFTGGGAATAAVSSGQYDIPHVWKDSSFSRSFNFDVQLRSPYGDPISIYQSIYIPLAMLLAGTMPRQIGKNTYTAPFNVRAYCRGKFAIPYGIIESLSLTRGDQEFGWNHMGLPTKVDISFTIKDLTPTLYMGLLDGVQTHMAILRSNTPFQEYINTLSGVPVEDRFYAESNYERRKQIASRMWSGDRIANWVGLHMGHSGIAQAALADALQYAADESGLQSQMGF